MATTADGALVEAARAGDQRAFGQLFDAWFDRVHDVSRRIVHDDGIAGEVAQDTFLRAWTKLDTLEDVDAFGGWVLRIGRNASLNRLEQERRSTVLDDESMTTLTDAASPDHDPLARLDQAGRIALVWDAAAALGERDASVLDLHLRHGLGAAELRAVGSSLPRGSLGEEGVATAVGVDLDGRPLVVVCSTGVYLDLVPSAADDRLTHSPDARLVLVVPARDAVPVTTELAGRLVQPAEVHPIAGDWRTPGGLG